MIHRLIAALLTACLAAGFAAAADDATAVPEDSDRFTIQTATCADVFDLYEDASPGEGKDAEKLAKAQDTVLLFVVWVHGYLSGRDGIDHDKRPLSKAGIEKAVKQIAEVCKPDDSKLFLDVVDSIK